ncbi:MAG: hypothetical protein ACYTG0_21305 [Planctomycetota bacterium]|jgi:hypothetical protein
MNRRHVWTIAAIGLLVTSPVWWPHAKAVSQTPPSSASESARRGREEKLEQQTQELVQQYRNAGDAEEREALQDDLERTVSRHFDLRQEARERELEWLEMEIARLRSLHERRQDEKNRIVQQRIEALLREADGLGWGSPDSSSIRSLDSQATVGQRPRPRKELSGRINTRQREEFDAILEDIKADVEAGRLAAMEGFEHAGTAAVKLGVMTEEEVEEELERLGELTEEEVEKEWREKLAEADSEEEEEEEWKEELHAIAKDLNAQFEAGELTAMEAFEEACKAAARLSGATEEKVAKALAKLDDLTEEEVEKEMPSRRISTPSSRLAS